MKVRTGLAGSDDDVLSRIGSEEGK
jgi:hypothetical protein